MQGQDKEGGNETANLDFKSSDIKKTDEGELFVNIEGDDERAALEAEAKAEAEKAEKAKQKAAERELNKEIKKKELEAKKAERRNREKKKNVKLLAIVLPCLALVIAGGLLLVYLKTSSNDPDTPQEPEFIYDAHGENAEPAVAIRDQYTDGKININEAYEKYEKLIEESGENEKFEAKHDYFKFALQKAQDLEKSEEILNSLCVDGLSEIEQNICAVEKSNLEEEKQLMGGQE